MADLIKPPSLNRKQRRQLQRKGKRAEREFQAIQDAARQASAVEQQQADQKVIKSAQNLRSLTSGRFYLPGDQ